MKTALVLVTALALAACAGQPVTDTTRTFCASLPAARLAADIALSRAERKPTKQDLADIKAVRAAEDARCAQAAASSAS